MPIATDMEVFVRVVRLGSLSAAARSLNLSPAAISYRMTKMEAVLGMRLMHRTTRLLTLTADGKEYLEKAQQVLATLEEFTAAASHADRLAQGTLKVTIPSSFGRQYIAPLVPKFLAQHPAVRMHLILDDEVADIIADGIDLAIRISKLKESELVAQKIAPDRRIVCAAPSYLQRHGTPRTLASLAEHNCLVLSQQPYWTFQHDGKRKKVKVRGNFECNNGEVLRELAISGMGLALKATWDIAPALRDGRLRQVLKTCRVADETSVWAVYPSRRNLPAKVRAFVAFLKEELRRQPWETRVKTH